MILTLSVDSVKEENASNLSFRTGNCLIHLKEPLANSLTKGRKN